MTPTGLKKWRKRLKLTQKAAAKRLGLSLRHFIRLETGDAAIKKTVELATRA